MASNFPDTSIDSFVAKIDSQDYPRAIDINELQEGIVAVQTKVGIDGSADDNSVDYKLGKVRSGERAVDVADIKMTARPSAPAGWLLCDGSAISRTTYADLFSAIGTDYGSGDGVTTFNVPNIKGKFVAGFNSTDTSFDTLGETGGAKTINIAHTHTGPNHQHTYSGNTGSTPSDLAGTTGYDPGGTEVAEGRYGHSHTISGTTAAAGTGDTSSALSSTQSVLNPYIVLNYVIKY